MEAKLKDLVDKMVGTARTLLEKRGNLVPTCFVFPPFGTPEIVSVDFENAEEKNFAYTEVSKLAKKKKAVAVLTINDAWIRSESPTAQRKEALNAVLILPDGSVSYSLVHPYERVGGKIVWSEMKQMDQGTEKQFQIDAWGSLRKA